MTDRIEIVEVGPRDGLQNDPAELTTTEKVSFIARAADMGAGRIEVASFVNPRAVPRMSDGAEVCATLQRGTGRHIGLALNRRGIDRAVAAGVDEVNTVVAVSDTFGRRNQGATAEGALEVIAQARRDLPQVRIGITVSTAFGCPFEGEVAPDTLMRTVDACMAADPFEIALADTIGVATPRDVALRVAAVRRAHPTVPVRLHVHDTRGTGIANAWAGLQAGVATLDASLGGIGGCPFAPGATGNIATEDLLYMLDRAGVATGMSLEAAIDAARWLERTLGHAVPGRVIRAGGFPTT